MLLAAATGPSRTGSLWRGVPAGIDIARWWGNHEIPGLGFIRLFASGGTPEWNGFASNRRTKPIDSTRAQNQFIGGYFIGWHLFTGTSLRSHSNNFASLPIGVDKANAGDPRFPRNSL